MGKQAIILGSNGVETAVSGTDIIAAILTQENWSVGVTRSFEFFAVDDIEVSVNGRSKFTLKAGDEIEEKEDAVSSFIVLTNGARYRYYAKF